ncbi:MAG TPA: deoxyribose-phosphate aldolase [Armatimonadota bacterium]|nr:deoxyribose-phosphate aldolase [Armatimonadota bacterium]
MIDHSLLGPALTDAELTAGCELAARYRVATVCIKPYFVSRSVELLDGSGVKPTTTIGFPHGGHATAIKVAEAAQAMDDGALELDMVVNVGRVLSEDWGFVRSDIGAVADAAHARGVLLKVIFENCFLHDTHKIRLCEICGEVRADFVKTSTGYGEGGATLHDLRLMRENSPAHVQIKAAGGVRTLDGLLAVREVGVTRVGASRTADILDECRQRLGIASG